MAGSYGHVDFVINGKHQFIGCTLLDHLGDGFGAIEELWFALRLIAGDDESKIADAIKQFNNPTSDLAIELKQRLSDASDNDYWEGELDDLDDEDTEAQDL